MSCLSQIHAQDSLKINNFVSNNKDLNLQLQQTSKEIKDLKNELLKHTSISDTAGKIIDWSAMIFGLFVIILGIAGWIAGKEFSEVRKLKVELKELLSEFRLELKKEQREIEDLLFRILKKLRN